MNEWDMNKLCSNTHSAENPQTLQSFFLLLPTSEVYNCFLDNFAAEHSNTEEVRYRNSVWCANSEYTCIKWIFNI
jgi:hypothetical protein